MLESVLENIATCRSLCRQLGMGGVSDASDPTHSLLALYQFEAKLKLGHRDLDNVLEQITKLELVEPKTYETIAALCVHSSENQHCLGVGMNALRTAVRCHLQASPVDGERLRSVLVMMPAGFVIISVIYTIKVNNTLLQNS